MFVRKGMHLQVVKINTSFSFSKWLENIVATWIEQTCVEFDISLLASADEARKKTQKMVVGHTSGNQETAVSSSGSCERKHTRFL